MDLLHELCCVCLLMFALCFGVQLCIMYYIIQMCCVRSHICSMVLKRQGCQIIMKQ